MNHKEIKYIFDSKAKSKYNGQYEFNRWFKTKTAKVGYEMTLKSINFHLEKHFTGCNLLELGPGSGTWTKILLSNKKVTVDLVDISNEMLRQAKENLQGYGVINYFENDFLDFNPEKKYELFFSSRVFEYLSDKEAAVIKISQLLKPDGFGFIISKTPKYFFNKLIGRKESTLHQGQINPDLLISLLRNNGFKNIKAYPVTISIPFLKSDRFNKFIHSLFYKHQLNFISRLFSESYCIKFIKT